MEIIYAFSAAQTIGAGHGKIAFTLAFPLAHHYLAVLAWGP
jgi:hypothetical protein